MKAYDLRAQAFWEAFWDHWTSGLR